MRDDLNPEILSAYLDGECSPKERLAVERPDAETVEELASLKKISGLIKQLPAESPPEHLASSVMQRIERAHLLEQFPQFEADFEDDLPRPRSAASRFVGYWMPAVIALTLLIGWGLRWRWTDTESLRRDIVMDSPTESAQEIESSARRELPTAARNSGMSSDLQLESSELNQSKKQAPLPGFAAGSEAPPAPEDPSSKLHFTSPLREADVGDVVEAIQNRGDDVVLVKLTVVDRQAGLQKLQLLLARHVPESASAGELAAAKTDSDDLLVAVLADLPDSRLQTAMKELTREPAIDEINVASGISRQTLGSYAVAMDSAVEQSESRRTAWFNNLFTPQSASKKTEAKEASPGRTVGNDPKSRDEQQNQAESSVSPAGSNSVSSALQTLALKPDILDAPQRLPRAQAGNRADRSSIPQADNAGRSRRILFVLIDKPDSPSVKGSPDKDGKSDGQGA